MRGSPPRMRGKLLIYLQKIHLVRITPAHAGKTCCQGINAVRPADHPRACGENKWKEWVSQEPCGSPPRMRGKPRRPVLHERHRRITPAHAGKTSRCSSPCPHPADHPRACGENPETAACSPDSGGSPPRMRGKQGRRQHPAFWGRITPAHAGKTVLTTPSISAPPDHPRACGENEYENGAKVNTSGSPPRMRGKPDQTGTSDPVTRITPAHAGKTISQCP